MRTWLLVIGATLLAIIFVLGCSKDGKQDYVPSAVQINGPEIAYEGDSVAFTFQVNSGTNPVESFQIGFEDSARVDTVIVGERPGTCVLSHWYMLAGLYSVTARISDGVSEPQISTHEITIATRADPGPEVTISVPDTLHIPADSVLDIIVHKQYDLVPSTFTFGGTGSGYVASIDTPLYSWDIYYRVHYSFDAPGYNVFWATIRDTRGVTGRDTVHVIVREE